MSAPADDGYRARCESAGWLYYKRSKFVRAMSGDWDGIAHTATLRGANVNDSIYGTWRACWLESVATFAEFEAAEKESKS